MDIQKITQSTPFLIIASLLFLVSGVFAFMFNGSPASTYIGPLFIVFLAVPSYYALSKSKRWKWILGSVILLGFFMESLSIQTGFPYSFFTYGEGMGPKVFGVPFTLAFAWPPLVIGAYYTMQRSPYPVLGSTLLLVLLDLVLDPVAVVLGHWEWFIAGVYYGVPFANFVGWLLTGFIASKVMSYSEELSSLAGVSTVLFLSFWIGVSAVSGMHVPFFLGLSLWMVLVLRVKQG